MPVPISLNSQIGVELADRLGLKLPRHEGHDLAGPCIACGSSDAFRLHQQTGVGHCYSCNGKWSPFQVAETVLRDSECAKAVMVEMGLFKPSTNGPAKVTDPIVAIANKKGVTSESLRAFGAQAVSPNAIQLPAYGPDGKACTKFTMSVQGGKGLFAKGKPAGLFFPHADSKVRVPQAGEIWHLVEGPKDAAALHGLGLLACGLNTCRLAAKFARLFSDVEIILIPDRDRAGEEGSAFTARVLRGVAKSVRIAVLPAEFKESGGDDVRDVLRQPGGRELVFQAIAYARQPDGWDDDSAKSPTVASADISLLDGEPLRLEVSPAGRKPQRRVAAIRGEVEHVDRLNTDSSASREKFIKRLAAKINIERDTLVRLVEPLLTKLADEIDEKCPANADRDHDESEAQSQATLAANMAADWVLWHTPAQRAFVTIPIGNHKQNWPVRSDIVKQFLSKQMFEEHGKAMNAEAISAAVNLLEAKARFDGEDHPVHVRVAEHDGNIYIDLCNNEWQAVQITPKGWKIVDDPPVRFRRSGGMLSLPAPETGGTVDQLRGFLNLDDKAWQLVISWLVAALRPRGPYPILALFAEQGSGKSTIGRLLRELIDPNSAPLRAEPHDSRDLMITANNSWCLAYDNLSHVQPWLSDALCRLSTGGGFATRELYSDQDEIIFDSQRPLLLTSIEEVASRSDLLDRCLIVWLPAIPEDRRRSEAELLEAFHKARPQILGALFDAVAIALHRLPSIKLESLPRMADFAVWATAAETAFGWSNGTFVAAYQGNRESANEVALEASVIARPLLDLLDSEGEWIGSSGELLKELEKRQGDDVRKQSGWPKNPRSLSGHLKRLAPNLHVEGWKLEQDRTSKKRTWTIRRAGQQHSSSPSASPDEQRESVPNEADWFGMGHDDVGDAHDGSAGDGWNPDRF